MGSLVAMPLMIALPYMFFEALAFWAVARWLGVGWALLLLIAFFFVGIVLAAWQMRAIASKLARGKQSAGSAAGDLGLVAAGAVGVALPGFVTSIFGLALILSPTRALARKFMAQRLRAKVERLGVRSFEATNAYRKRASYGSFGGGEVLEEEDIRRWSSNIDPDDFRNPNA